MSKNGLRHTIIDLLVRIDEDSGYSHLLIANEIKKRKISSKDERLLTEIVYGTIERKLTLDYYLAPFIENKQKIQPWVRMVLRMSVYQMVYLDKVPDYAVINEAVEIAKQKGHKGIASFVNGVLRNVQRKGVRDISEITDPVKRLSIETSHPEWLVERWMDHYGRIITEKICQENLAKKPIAVRVQPLRISREEAMKQLIEQGFKVRPSMFSNQGIIVDEGNILHAQLFAEGFLTVQDQSSMLVGEMLHVQPGMKVLDTCSAPGGKVTHIAEKMLDKGSIHAFDLHKKKIKLIDQKKSELQLSVIDAKHGDARHLGELLEHDSYDRIVVDAPCSGLGVTRSKPDVKYSKSIDDIYRLAHIQLDILNSVAPLLKKGGLLVYSTCTIDKEENEHTVKRFLESHHQFEIDQSFFQELPESLQKTEGVSTEGLQLFPHEFHTDGFFITRMIKQ